MPDLTQTKVVSVIDDDLSIRKATARLLRQHGYQVHDFDSAEAFLESSVIGLTHCLVSDVRMPGISGLELQDRLAAMGYRIPIIFVTAFPEERARQRALAAGAAGFLQKPFDALALTGLIERALGPSD